MNDYSHLDEKIIALLNKTISDEAFQELDRLLQRDPRAKQHYIEFMAMVSGLEQQLGQSGSQLQDIFDSQDGEPTRQDLLRDIIDAEEKVAAQEYKKMAYSIREKVKFDAEEKLLEYLSQQEKATQSKSQTYLQTNFVYFVKAKKIITALAACMVVGVCLWVYMQSRVLPSVAKIISNNQSVWANSNSLQDGAVLETKTYELLAGLAEIEFSDGAKIILEGPSEITLTSANGAILDHGKLTAQVPERAKGFTIETSLSSIVDFGTEFGVEVDSNANVMVHVFKGSVGIERNHLGSKEYTLIGQGQAKRLEKVDGNVAVFDLPADHAYFANSLNKQWDGYLTASKSSYQKYIKSLRPEYYFPFGSTLEGMEGFVRKNGNPVIISAGPKLYTDQTNYALELDSEKEYVVLDVFRREEKREAFSMMLWVKQNINQTDVTPLLYSATSKERGYPVIALYLENQSIVFDSASSCDQKKDVEQLLISESDFVPNQWTCIVVAKKEDGDISLYVNGNHDKTISKGADCPLLGWKDVYLGFNYEMIDDVAYEVLDDPAYGVFDGSIDEVAFFNYALTPKQVNDIYKFDQSLKK